MTTQNLLMLLLLLMLMMRTEKRVDNSLVLVCSLVIKSSFCSDKYSRFSPDIEVDVQARF